MKFTSENLQSSSESRISPGIHDNGPPRTTLWRLTLTAYRERKEFFHSVASFNNSKTLHFCQFHSPLFWDGWLHSWMKRKERKKGLQLISHFPRVTKSPLVLLKLNEMNYKTKWQYNGRGGGVIRCCNIEYVNPYSKKKVCESFCLKLSIFWEIAKKKKKIRIPPPKKFTIGLCT